jgi:hypothetical protein
MAAPRPIPAAPLPPEILRLAEALARVVEEAQFRREPRKAAAKER